MKQQIVEYENFKLRSGKTIHLAKKANQDMNETIENNDSITYAERIGMI